MAPTANINTQKLLQYLPKNGNYDFSSLIGQVGNQLQGASYNEIAWFTQAIQSGDTGNIIQAGVSAIGDIFSNLSTNDAAQDTKTNNRDEQKIENNNDKANDIFSSVNESLQTIFSECEGKQAEIQNALEKIEKLGGDKGLIAKKQEELQEKIAQIKAQQEILNNPDSKSADRKNAIKTILSLVSDINGLYNEVAAYKEELENHQQNVHTASEEVDQLSDDMQQVVTDGTAQTEELTQENIQLMADGTQKVAESIKKNALGTEQITVGTAMETGPQALVTGSEGAQLIASGTSKIAGGAELMSGAMRDFKNISNLASNIQQNVQSFTNFAQGIGEFNTGIKDLVGAFDSTVEPMISSIGSWESVLSTNQALGQYTTQYAQNIGMNEVNNDGSIDESQENNNELSYQKYEFDMSAFDNAFEKQKI